MTLNAQMYIYDNFFTSIMRRFFPGNTQLSHEAGFDAYVTGFCFLKIAHLATSVDEM